MSPPILVNDALVDVSFTKDGTFKTVDLAGLLNHDDPKAVILHAQNPAGGARSAGAKAVGSAMAAARTTKALVTWNSGQWAVSLNGGTSVQLLATDSNVAIGIHAEIGGDDAVIYVDGSSLGGASPNAWRTIDRTANYGADAGAVVASLLYFDWVNAGDFGFREFGSIENFHPNNINQSCTFGIVGVDSLDRYQTYQSQTGGKSPVWQAFIHEIGYLKSGWNGVTDPVDEGLSTTSAYTDHDITGVTSADANVALARFNNTHQTLVMDFWARPDAGSQAFQSMAAATTRHALVNLTPAQVYEYYISNVSVDEYILGWADVIAAVEGVKRHFGPTFRGMRSMKSPIKTFN